MRPALARLGPAALNRVSETVLGYPALLISCDYEIRTVLARLES